MTLAGREIIVESKIQKLHVAVAKKDSGWLLEKVFTIL